MKLPEMQIDGKQSERPEAGSPAIVLTGSELRVHLDRLPSLSKEGIDTLEIKTYVEDVEIIIRAKRSNMDKILSYLFGFVFVSAILALAVFIPDPTPSQKETFRIVLSLAAGGIAAVIPGLLNLQINFGVSRGAQTLIRAGGALAVFAIVYFYSPGILSK